MTAGREKTGAQDTRSRLDRFLLESFTSRVFLDVIFNENNSRRICSLQFYTRMLMAVQPRPEVFDTSLLSIARNYEYGVNTLHTLSCSEEVVTYNLLPQTLCLILKTKRTIGFGKSQLIWVAVCINIRSLFEIAV